MNIKQLLEDDGAVSPVIGVILMVAITVILAAVIASFVLGLGNNMQTQAPQAQVTFDYVNESGGVDTLDITHDGGETLQPSTIHANVEGAYMDDTADGSYEEASWEGDLFSDYSSVTTGNSRTLGGQNGDFVDASDNSLETGNDALDLSQADVTVVWESESGKNSASLNSWSGPEA